MSDGNMICPGCKTFQPRAETCQKCGAIVSKLWSRDPPAQGPLSRKRESPVTRPPALLAAAAALVIAGAGYGLWTVVGDTDDTGDRRPVSPMGTYLEAARDAQHAAELTRERMEAAVYEAETGLGGSAMAVYPSGRVNVDLDLDRLAAEMNTVSQVAEVNVDGADLEPTIHRCAGFIRRYFNPLRFGAAEPYPLPARATEPYQPGGLDGRYRCEGTAGTVFTDTAPRSQGGIARCWKKVDPPRGSIPGSDRRKPPTLWVEMQWDAEAGRWAVYTRADQRTVDAGRLPGARRLVEADIQRLHGRREERARERIPVLSAEIESLRERLAIAASETLRQQHSLALARTERELREALVERRYTWLCNTAAGAALDALARHLDSP